MSQAATVPLATGSSARACRLLPRVATVFALVLVTLLTACRSAPKPPVTDDAGPYRGWSQRGLASWYGPGFQGNATASGEIFDTEALTAAHKKLPFHTIVEVVNLKNGRRVRVRINDRGPFVRGRVIDLSRAAAERLDMIGDGVAKVQLHVVGSRPPATARIGPWTVQVAAFRDPGRARRLARQLRADFPAARVRSDPVWHRVQIGTYDDPDEAQRIADRVERTGYQALVVKAEPRG